jgi:hypothetical protein
MELLKTNPHAFSISTYDPVKQQYVYNTAIERIEPQFGKGEKGDVDALYAMHEAIKGPLSKEQGYHSHELEDIAQYLYDNLDDNVKSSIGNVERDAITTHHADKFLGDYIEGKLEPKLAADFTQHALKHSSLSSLVEEYANPDVRFSKEGAPNYDISKVGENYIVKRVGTDQKATLNENQYNRFTKSIRNQGYSNKGIVRYNSVFNGMPTLNAQADVTNHPEIRNYVGKLLNIHDEEGNLIP